MDYRNRLYDRYVSDFKDHDRYSVAKASPAHERWMDFKILPLLRDTPADARILELGCGPGVTLDYLRRRGFTRVHGVDISEEQVEVARDLGASVERIDAQQFLIAAINTYDVILAFDFLEHFSRPELLDLLPRVFEALTDGGKLILQTPNGRGLLPNQVIYGDLTHLTILTPETLAVLLRTVGFADLRFFETGPIPNTLRGVIRTIAWRIIVACAKAVRRIETGKVHEIWTENMICYCRRPSRQ